MDKKQLLTIAATALITWTITKLASWLLEVAKTKATSATTIEKLKTAFNKNNRTIIVDVCWIIFCLFFLITTMMGTSPVTRSIVFYIVFYTLGTAAFSIFLVIDIIVVKTRSRMSQISEALNQMNSALEKAKEPILPPDNASRT